VVFGGSTAETENVNSVARIKTALTARGYAAAEQRIVNPAGSAAQMKAAWQWVGANVTPTTQVYYWNSWGHGTRSLDVKGEVQAQQQQNNQPVGLLSGDTYSFTMPSDLAGEMQSVFNYFTANGASSPLDLPYFEVQTSSLIGSLQVHLNGNTLSSLGTADLYGDGSEYDYWFGLNSSDIAGLASLSSSTLSMNWSGPSDPGFGLVDVNVGDSPNSLSVKVIPEPSTAALLMVAGALGAGFLVRRDQRRRRTASSI
jgi:hypothetical protein